MFLNKPLHFAPETSVPILYPVGVSGMVSGIVAGTRIETGHGWRRVETLRPGDLVHSFDGGLRPVLRIDRRVLRPDEGHALIRLAGGILETCADLVLAPDQRLLLRDPSALVPERAHLLIPARALRGCAGTLTEALRERVEIFVPVFECEEVIFANTGARLYCPGSESAAPDLCAFPPADPFEAAALLDRLGLCPAAVSPDREPVNGRPQAPLFRRAA